MIFQQKVITGAASRHNSPFEFYDDMTAIEALGCAEKICDFCIINGKKYE